MEQRDYIKRQIEQISILLGRMLASADAETVIKELQTKGFDYDLLIRLRGVIDSMAASLPENDRRRQSLTDLSDKLAAGTQAAHSTVDFSDFQ